MSSGGLFKYLFEAGQRTCLTPLDARRFTN
jgi:hypothetical protein